MYTPGTEQSVVK